MPVQKEKLTKAASPKQTQIRTNHVLEQMHLDLCGPLRTESFDQNRYILNIVDDYSRIIFARGLRSKDEAGKHVMEVIQIAEVMTEVNFGTRNC
jgi:hypothetical protein